jgi:hypothetical protein
MKNEQLNKNLLENGLSFDVLKEMTTKEILNLMNQFKGVLEE